MPKCKAATIAADNDVDINDGTSRTIALALGVGKSSINDHRSGTCVCATSKIHKIHNKAKNVRVLTLDIEYKPLISAHWGLFKQHIGIAQIIDHGGLLCFSAKWYDEGEAMFFSEWGDGYEPMVRKAWELMDEADILVTYNGQRYDSKKINGDFMKLGLTPPKPYKHVDLFRVNKAQFDLPSRKLDYIAQQTIGDGKTSHTGFQLWMDVMGGNAEAQALMEEYNVQDVLLTEKLFDRLRPWLKGTAHIGAIAGVHASCPNCGSTKLKRNGNANAFVATYKAYICEDCSTHVRGTVRLQDTTGTRSYA